MKLIEPCCAERHIRELRDALKDGSRREIEGYEDLSLTELLPAILTRYYETEVLIAAPALPDQAAEIIDKWMRRTIARMDGTGRLNYVARLTIVADLSPEQSPMASEWLKENPFADRLTLIDHAQPDTALLLPDFAITGPVNLRYGRHFTATATTVQEEIDALWMRFSVMGKKAEAEPTEEPTEQPPAHAGEGLGAGSASEAAPAAETAAEQKPQAKPAKRTFAKR